MLCNSFESRCIKKNRGISAFVYRQRVGKGLTSSNLFKHGAVNTDKRAILSFHIVGVSY